MSKKQKTVSFKRLISISLLVAALVMQFIPVNFARADTLQPRKLTLHAGPTGQGGSLPGGLVNHIFALDILHSYTIGSIKLLYCTTAAPTDFTAALDTDCTMPTGVVTTNGGGNPTSITDNNTGVAQGFAFSSSVDGTVLLTRTAALASIGTINFTIANVNNPTTNVITNSGTFFVRILIYTSEDGSGVATDTATVAASTATKIDLSGYMPESLVFCTGATISETDNVPDCRTVTTGAITFNQLFSPSDTAYSTSQMAASTNAGTGYVITVNGATLTSGVNTIAAMNTAGHPIRGVAQFGLNLVHNTGIYNGVNYSEYAAANGGFGLNISDASNQTNLRGQPAVGTYDTAEQFKYTTGDPVANSADDVAGPSDAQIYTVSYIANVTGSQPAGTYTTTLTYICTPTY